MNVEVHRKHRLRELMNHSCSGVIAVLAARMDRSESYVSRMLYPPEKTGAKPIADKMMRVIEEAFGLERAWLDMPLGHKLPGVNPSSSNTTAVEERRRVQIAAKLPKDHEEPSHQALAARLATADATTVQLVELALYENDESALVGLSPSLVAMVRGLKAAIAAQGGIE